MDEQISRDGIMSNIQNYMLILSMLERDCLRW